jgi:tRNA/rRNA methyltransferase
MPQSDSMKPRKNNKLPAVALVEPHFAQNVGYCARVMANFGASELYVVSGSQKQIDWQEATKFASHGEQVIRKIKHVKSFDSLRRRFSILVGTTAIRAVRKSNISRTTREYNAFVPELLRALKPTTAGGAPQKMNDICFVFGRDTTGLTNEELRQCDFAVTIETGTSYRTLNISHALAIVLYELHKFLKHSFSDAARVRHPLTSGQDVRQLVVKRFLELADLSDFQKYKREKLSESLRHLINRGNPSMRETYLLLGLASRACSTIKRLEKAQASS